MANKNWTSSSNNSGSYSSKWGTGYPLNWAGGIIPNTGDVATFATNSFNKYNIQIQPNTVTGGVQFNNTSGNLYTFSTNTLTVGSQGINNQSGRSQNLGSISVSGNQSWSGGSNASIVVTSINFLTSNTTLTYYFQSSSTLTIDSLSSTGTNNTLIVSGGSTIINGGAPTSNISFEVNYGYLSTSNQSNGFSFDSSYSSLLITNNGTYNNSGPSTWNSVSMQGGILDLIGVDISLLINTTYSQAGGNLTSYIGYDNNTSSVIFSTIQVSGGSGPFTLGGALTIDCASLGNTQLPVGTTFNLISGSGDGSNFSTVYLANVDQDSPYYGLPFDNFHTGVVHTDLGTDGTYLSFNAFTGNLTVMGSGTKYYNAAQDTNWANLNNWWQDSDYTIPAINFPIAQDDVVMIATCDTNSDWEFYGDPVIANLTMSDPNEVNPNLGIDVSVSETATFHDTSTLSSILTGNAIFNEYASILSFSQVIGTATFNNYSSTYNSLIDSTATFNHYSSSDNSSFNSGGNFNNNSSSINSDFSAMIGYAGFTFNDKSVSTNSYLGESATYYLFSITGSPIKINSVSPYLTFTRGGYGTNNSNILGLP